MYGELPDFKPGKDDVVAHFSKCGIEGSMPATVVDLEAETEQWIAETPPAPRLTQQYVEDGRLDYKELLYTFKNNAKRKGSPE